MKIAVIGPVPPFRSGVAKHTGCLARALEAHGSVRTVSFARQYPAFLFPGSDDRDPATADEAPVGTEYLLDSLSPLNWRSVASALLADRPDLAVLPAWTFSTAPALTFIAQTLRAKGTRVVSVVHNAADHEGAGWKRALLSRQIAASDAAITHNQGLADGVHAIRPDLPVAISPHPLFDYPDAQGTLARRAKLELLMFGLLRPYKGADLLVEAMGALAGRDVRLSIVGEVWGDGAPLRRQIAESPACEQIELVDRYVGDGEAAEFFHRADVLVLPYRHVTGSGVVPLAIRYARPVIASDLPGFRDLVVPGETGWRVAPGDPQALSQCLRARLELDDAGLFVDGLVRARAALSWSRFAAQLMDVAEAASHTQAGPAVRSVA